MLASRSRRFTGRVRCPTGRPAHPGGHGVGYVDTVTGRWELPGGTLTYGNPGDVPVLGDWDCDGVATPGLYRRSDGYVYLRNSNSSGVADVRFYFGDPGDVPIAGDFDGDGCDTVSLYRPGTGRVHLIDRLGSGRQGLGAADRSYAAGAGEPLAGDFDGDGRDDVALHDRAGGRITIHHARHPGGERVVRAFGDPGDLLVAADWDGDARAELAAFRPAAGTVHLEDGSVAAAPGGSRWFPVAVP